MFIEQTSVNIIRYAYIKIRVVFFPTSFKMLHNFIYYGLIIFGHFKAC